ncbi:MULTISPECIES: NADPH-dependent F420 reductase [unclassified Streptomyces]|uniref:NADPH-dependent F420 reductase n=1 Tax=unclassified Streptomyces TaxID=2593676 RepID=UPI003813668C
MTKTLGLIGAGNIGSALARLAVAAGLDVVLSNSRGPETLTDLVAELGPRARAATPAEAAEAGDLVVATILLGAYEKLPAAELAGKTVIDTMNYYPDRFGPIAELDEGGPTGLTSSALVQRHLAASKVVKAFHNIDFVRLFTLARPVGAPDRSALPISGDDAAAKAEAAALLDVLGYDAVDIGTLADSWRSQPGTPVHVDPYFTAKPAQELSQEEMYGWYLRTPGTTVGIDQVRALADSAVHATPDHA